MAFLKKWIDKATFMLISGAWTAVSTAVMTSAALHPVATTLIVSIGNLVIIWIAVETHSSEET